jgi:hypothetical protein
MQKLRFIAVSALFMTLAASCGSNQRFMNFGWNTPKHEVIDSVKDWGFTFNSEKQRWDKGMLNGVRCNKLKLWFSDDSLLQGAEAKYQELDTALAAAPFARYESQLRAEHGSPTIQDKADGSVKLSRLGWKLSGNGDTQNDMIVIDRFRDYVLFHAARNMPPVFEMTSPTDER